MSEDAFVRFLEFTNKHDMMSGEFGFYYRGKHRMYKVSVIKLHPFKNIYYTAESESLSQAINKAIEIASKELRIEI